MWARRAASVLPRIEVELKIFKARAAADFAHLMDHIKDQSYELVDGHLVVRGQQLTRSTSTGEGRAIVRGWLERLREALSLENEADAIDVVLGLDRSAEFQRSIQVHTVLCESSRWVSEDRPDAQMSLLCRTASSPAAEESWPSLSDSVGRSGPVSRVSCQTCSTLERKNKRLLGE